MLPTCLYNSLCLQSLILYPFFLYLFTNQLLQEYTDTRINVQSLVNLQEVANLQDCDKIQILR